MQGGHDIAGAMGRSADLPLLTEQDSAEGVPARPPRPVNAGAHVDNRFRCLFDNNIDAVFSLDCTGRFVEANPAAERLSGYSQHELQSMDFAELCAIEDRHKAMFFFARAMSGASRSIELSAICRDGSCVDLYVTGAPINVDGVMTGLFCTARDITRKRRAEAQLRRARRDAEQAKDRFLSVLSHELRTPLMPVLTTVQMLERQPDLSAEMHDLLGMMRRNLELEARLIDDLLDLNRIRQGKLTLSLHNVDLHQKIQHVLQLCAGEIAGKGINVQVDMRASERMVAADGPRINQVLWNIIGNAAKFTPEGGSIRVVTCNGKPNPTSCSTDCGAGKPICNACGRSRSRRFIAIHVTDTGVGLSEESMRHLFDAFDRVDCEARHGSGRGISLSISKALVELHGGQLVVHSNGPGKGTTFTVTLPVSRMPGRKSARLNAARHPSLSTAGRKVLLVEDHPDTARVLSRLLTIGGFVVQVASTVQAAIEHANQSQFDLLISDIGLPDGTGLDVVRHVRELRPIPAIALSGYGMQDDINRSRDAGFAEHLIKPIDIAQLQLTIQRLLAVE